MHLLARHYHPTLQRGHQDARGGKSPGRRHTAQLGRLALAGMRRRALELLPCLRARKLCLRTWLGPSSLRGRDWAAGGSELRPKGTLGTVL